MNQSSARIEMVDSLRGFAIMGIMLLHNLEHFDFYFIPQDLPPFIQNMDGHVWNVIKFMFARKAYGIFALLFGFSFYIMNQKQVTKGADFKGRFMWRMLLLFGFGLVNGMLFEGDILTFYAALGFVLPLTSRLSNKMVLVIAIILLLQPFEVGRLIYTIYHPEYEIGPRLSFTYFHNVYSYLGEGNLWDSIVGNSTNGRWAVILWSWEEGRFFQAPGLFLLGMILGRLHRFAASKDNSRFWIKTLVICCITSVILYVARESISDVEFTSSAVKRTIRFLLKNFYNFTFLFSLVALFYQIYYTTSGHKVLSILEPMGKMSLSSYLMQSVMGAVVYYNFGFGLFRYTGATYSLLIGIVLFLIQLYFSKWWMKNHKQGPLEYWWHKWTWVRTKINIHT